MPVALTNRRRKPRVSSVWAQSFCRKLLEALGCPAAELSVSLVGDVEIRPLNLRWRDKDKATDVLSFSQIEGEVPWPTAPSGTCPTPSRRGAQPRRQLGDIVISLDTAQRQAEQLGHSLQIEVARLLIHGAAHLLGHDHVHGGEEARAMYRLEARLMKALGVPLRP